MNVDSEKSMCVIMKSVSRMVRGILSKCYMYSTALIQQTKQRTTLIFTSLRLVGLLKVGPGAKVSNVFLLNTVLLGFSGYFLQLNRLC